MIVEILENIGCTVQKDKGTLIIDAAKAEHFLRVAASLGERMRSTIILLGSMGEMPFPGGCIIGMRPIDIHILPWKDGSYL